MENIRGAALMVVAMGLFAIEDAIIKGLATTMPVGQILSVTCLGGLSAFVVWFKMRGIPLWQPEYLDRKVLLRTGFDAGGSAMFATSLTLIPLTVASAVIQATPLMVAMGAALFLGQDVGWRRWLAILAGFIGVMIIIRPGMEGFEIATLLAVAGVMGLAARDLLTRALNVSLSGAQLTTHTFAAVIPVGLLLCFAQGQSLVLPNLQQYVALLGCITFGVLAYLCLVAATRNGNVGMISSFRYSRMVYALILGYIFFNETPDIATIIGVIIIIASGLFTLMREARLRRASLAPKPAL